MAIRKEELLKIKNKFSLEDINNYENVDSSLIQSFKSAKEVSRKTFNVGTSTGCSWRTFVQD